MFTLQVLDEGRSFQHPLPGAAVTIGSGGDADLALRAPGVAAAHARLTVVGDDLQLAALAPVKVNGKDVAAATLQVGDRIEIGGAYLVLGRAVAAAAARPASAPSAAAAPASPRAPRPAARPAGAPRVLLGAVGVAVVGLAAFALLGGDSQQALRDQLAVARRLRETAKLEDASAKLDQLAQEWADATDERLQWLQQERDAIAAAAAAAATLRAQVLDPADTRSYGQWQEELQRLERSGSPDRQVGARIVRGSLMATIRQRQTAGGSSADAAPAAATTTTIESTRKTDGAEATKLAAQGLFAPALSLLEASLGEQDDADGVRAVQARIAEVRQQAKAAMATHLAEAAGLAPNEPLAAAKVLHAVRHRFPPGGEFAALDERIRGYEQSAAAGGPPTPSEPVARRIPAAAAPAPARPAAPTPAAPDAPDAPAVADAPASVGAPAGAALAALRKLLDEVRRAEEVGDFAAAAQGLLGASVAVRERDAAYADRLTARAEEATLCDAWHDAVGAALVDGAKLDVALLAGGKAALKEADGPRLVLAADGRRISWHDVAPEGVAALAEQLKVRGEAALGASALLYRKSANAAAEALLAKTLKAEPTRKDAADRVIARGRGEPLAAGGYTLGKDGFSSVRSLAIQKQATAFRARLDEALRDRSGKVRTDLWGEVMAAGPDAVQAFAAALKRELQVQASKFDKPSWRKDHEKLVAARQNLDAARNHARELIYDEAKYFYPYKPPTVSSERYAEYVRVQAEVNRRVEALRAVWNDGKQKLTVPGSVRADLERIDWIAERLADLGDGDDAALARVAWARPLTPGRTISVQDLALTVAEAAEFDEWRRIERYNDLVGRTLASAQREQLKVTNGYRAMYRHRPLAIVPVVCTAAQGHAEEMSKLGYFAHQSPTPGRTTPYDRMRLAGYDRGASENIALVDGAEGAHNAWCQSSGHHRNLLEASHHEIGVGNDGRYWVQNFGRGQVYRESVAWDQAETGK